MQHDVTGILPNMIREQLGKMGLAAEDIQEIRIRTERPMMVVSRGKEYISSWRVVHTQINEILSYLSGYSLYAYDNEMRQGFLSLPGGHRVGLVGRTVLEQGEVKTVTEVSSLNIRFAHEVKGCADQVLPYIWKEDRLCHTLIASAPGKGKTTLLRDCIRQIADGSKVRAGLTVGVVDERSEIAGNYRGIPGNDLGLRSDVLEGCPKAKGMMMLVRSMAPDVIAVDEIGRQDELEAMAFAMNCGCVMLATVHGTCMEELLKKPVLRSMVEQSVFERYIFLDNGKMPGRVRQIVDMEGRDCLRQMSSC